MVRLILLGCVVGLSTGCLFPKKPPTATVNREKEKLALLDADRAFSKVSQEKGMKTAFMDYIDSNGVLLRPGQLPIVGADAVDFLSQLNDREYTMKWEPAGGDIAKSGDLGYTYGTYQVIYKAGGADSIFYGTYVNVWKKQGDSTWKYVLDSGNEGVSETMPEAEMSDSNNIP